MALPLLSDCNASHKKHQFEFEILNNDEQNDLYEEIINAMEYEIYNESFYSPKSPEEQEASIQRLCCFLSHPQYNIKIDSVGTVYFNGNITDSLTEEIVRNSLAHFEKTPANLYSDSMFYSRISLKQINDNITDEQQHYNELLYNKNTSDDLLYYYKSKIHEWEKLRELALLAPNHDLKSHNKEIILSYTNPNQSLRNLYHAFYLVRDDIAISVFNSRYKEIYLQAVHNKDPLAQKQLAYLKYTYPLHVIDDHWEKYNAYARPFYYYYRAILIPPPPMEE